MPAEVVATETPAVVPPVIEHEKPAGLVDHVQSFDPQPDRAALAEQSQEQEKPRDEAGKFRGRHRARKDVASPEDVPRIKALTAKLRAAEDELATYKKPQVVAPPVVAPVVAAEPPKPAVATPAPAKAEAPAADDPEPSEADLEAKFGGDYMKFLAAHARWSVRDENRKIEMARADAERQARDKEAGEAVIKNFQTEAQKSRQKHKDYDAVALSKHPAWIDPNTNLPWVDASTGKPHPQSALIDRYVLERKTREGLESGSEVLYYLQSHPEEQTALLQMPPDETFERLTLLAQRLAVTPKPTVQAGPPGAVARQTVKQPPRPFTPERTEAQSANEGPPPKDGSLSVVGHAKAFRYR